MRGIRTSPVVSASLIHEVRMIVQQFLTGRQENYWTVRAAEARAKAKQAPTLQCCFCVGKVREAVTILAGYAVCTQHEAGMRHHHKDYQAYASRMSS